jgi:hypothetical protein
LKRAEVFLKSAGIQYETYRAADGQKSSKRLVSLNRVNTVNTENTVNLSVNSGQLGIDETKTNSVNTGSNIDDISPGFDDIEKIPSILNNKELQGKNNIDDKIPIQKNENKTDCGHCYHFSSDVINPDGGMGKCIVKAQGRYPFKPACQHFETRH